MARNSFLVKATFKIYKTKSFLGVIFSHLQLLIYSQIKIFDDLLRIMF